jgi:hypothetical protein
MSTDKHKNEDGTYNGIEVMSELTGISVGKITSIWQRVQENGQKLEACPYHEFELDSENKTMTRHQYRCKNCGGTVNNSMYRWHEIGRNSVKP